MALHLIVFFTSGSTYYNSATPHKLDQASGLHIILLVAVTARLKSFLLVCRVKDNIDQPQRVQTLFIGKYHCHELLKVNMSSLPPVATLWHLINKRSPILHLVGKRVLITHILKDILGTSDYNSEWSWEDMGTMMNRRNGKCNTSL